MASTFSGESCQFGQSSVQLGWSTQFLQQLSGKNAVYFIPSFFVATSAFPDFKGIIDGMLNVIIIPLSIVILIQYLPLQWNSAWPTQITANTVSSDAPSVLDSLSTEIGTFTTDKDYISALNTIGATYMPTVSPWFFTHYSKQTYNKNVSHLLHVSNQF